jgi:hypothetical protein
MPLKHVPIVMGHVNRPRTLELWAIAHEIAIKRENRESFVVPLKPHIDFINRLRTPRLWAIAHENGHKI